MGLLDILGSGTPQADTLGQGLLGLGAGLLSGGAYGAFGPALGRGFAGAQQGIQQGQMNAYRNAQTQMLQQQLNMARQRQAGGLSLLSAMFGGAAPSAAPEPLLGNAASPAAPEPLLGNAPRPAPSDSLLGGTGATTYPVSTSGAASSPPPAISSAPMLSPNQKMRAAADWFFNNGKGISDILKPNIQNVRPGGVVFDATTGKPVFAAVDASGRQITYDANGNPVANTIPGWNKAVTDTSQAQSEGAAAGKKIGEMRGSIESGERKQQAILGAASMSAGFSSLDRMKQTADAIINAPGFDGISWGNLAALRSLKPGSPEADAVAHMNTLKSEISQNVLQMYRDMSKTGGAVGNVSDAEQQLFQNNLAALGRAQSSDQIRSSLQRIMDFVDQSEGRLRTAYDAQYGAGAFDSYMKGKLTMSGNPVSPVPAVKPVPPKTGDVLDGWRFLGGDPSSQQSWQKVGG